MTISYNNSSKPKLTPANPASARTPKSTRAKRIAVKCAGNPTSQLISIIPTIERQF